MENRLARQGLLAAPESILSSKPSRHVRVQGLGFRVQGSGFRV